MERRCFVLFLLTCLLGCDADPAKRPGAGSLSDTVVVLEGGGDLERLAAEELRRYVHLLTGTLPPLACEIPPGQAAIVVRTGPGPGLPADGPDSSQCFALRVVRADPPVQELRGASGVATLWAAYTLIESWGVGFYLGGDALPPVDPRRPFRTAERQERPAFAVRGSLPWYNFLDGPSAWNLQDYLTFFEQLSKQKANFVGLHAYDYEPFCADAETLGEPALTTTSPHRYWSPAALATTGHLFGTALPFNRPDWGCETGIQKASGPLWGLAVHAQQQMLARALSFARSRGIRTCLGFEVSGNPDDPEVRRRLERRLRHILATYPLDCLALWQMENVGTGEKVKQSIVVDDDIREAFSYLPKPESLAEAARITKFVRLTRELLHRMAPQVRLVMSGWGGDQWMHFTSLYPGLDKVLPKDVVFSALDNIDATLEPNISKAYAECSGDRERWPILWFESDGGHTRTDQTGPQPNVVPYEALIRDAAAKRCQGLLGIHWRVRNVEEAAGYAFRSAWEPGLTPEAYYRRWVTVQYGPDHVEELIRMHLRLEELGPQYTGAAGPMECWTSFAWFVEPPKETSGWTPGRAGKLPDPSRFPELEGMSRRLGELEREALAAGRTASARALADRRRMIVWMLARARTGMAIWGDEAPLEATLRHAERLKKEGFEVEARQIAEEIVTKLPGLGFREGLQALADTCRTRGETGMLHLANARYGRYYAFFLSRLESVLGRPLRRLRGTGDWLTAPRLFAYPVPGVIPQDDPVTFDVVVLAEEVWEVRAEISGALLPLLKQGGGCWRAVWTPTAVGSRTWRIVATLTDGREIPWPPTTEPPGILTVIPAAGRPKPVLAEVPDDFSAPFAYPTNLEVLPSASLQILGPPGRFVVDSVPEGLEVSPREGRFPAALRVTAKAEGGRPFTFSIRLPDTGQTLAIRGFALRQDWELRFHAWKRPEKAAPPENWAALIKAPPLDVVHVPALDRVWGTAPPTPLVPGDGFVTEASAEIDLAEGEYEISTVSDEGIRVRVDGKELLSRWEPHLPQTDTARVSLKAGRHRIEVDHYEFDYHAQLQLTLRPLPAKAP